MRTPSTDQPLRLLRSDAVALWLGLACALAYARSLTGQFVSDDINAIVSNEWVTGRLDIVGIFTHFSWWGSARADAIGYRPLVTLTFALNALLGGTNAVGYHAVNLVFHTLVAWLLFRLSLALAVERRWAFTSALVFVVLPIHTEAVAWVVGRAELMAAAGAAASLLAGLRYRASGDRRLLLGCATGLLAGLLSKENAVTIVAAPALAALCLERSPASLRRDLLWAASLLVALCAYVCMRALAGPLLPATTGNLLDNPLAVLPPARRLLGALAVLGRYLWLTVVPWPLSVDYSFNALGVDATFIGDRFSLLALAVLGCATYAALRSRASRSPVAFALLLSAATYSIVSNTVATIGTIMAERLFYLPSLCLCLALGPALAAVSPRHVQRTGLALAAITLVYMGIDLRRCGDWRTPVALFESTVHAYPDSARAHMELASAYGRQNLLPQALEQFDRALAIKPDYAAAAYNKGNLLVRHGTLPGAVQAYRTAVQANPALTSAWYNLGLTYQLSGDPNAALDAFERARALAPYDAGIAMSRADVLLDLGRWAEAVQAYTEAIEQGGAARALLINRGVAKQRLSGCAAALPDYLAATRVAQPLQAAFVHAVACLDALGRGPEARALEARGQVANGRTGR